MLISTDKSYSELPAVYKAGYRIPAYLWLCYLVLGFWIALWLFFCLRMLESYHQISDSKLREYVPFLSGMQYHTLALLLMVFIVVCAVVVFSVRLIHMVRREVLFFTANGISWIRMDLLLREVIWQDILTISYLNISGVPSIVRIQASDGYIYYIPGLCLYDANKAIELIREHAHLTKQRKGVIWIWYEKIYMCRDNRPDTLS